MELQALADVGKRHVISLAMLIVFVVGIGQMQPEAVVPALDAHLDHTGRGSRLDSVVDGVFHQGLQEHRRHQSLLDGRIQPPIDPEALAQAQLLQVEILTAQRELVPESDQLTVVDHDSAEQFRQILQSALGSLRILANRSEEHTSELQSHSDLVCRLLLEKKKNKHYDDNNTKTLKTLRTVRDLDILQMKDE